MGTTGGLEQRWTDVAGRPVRSLVAGVPRDGVPQLVVLPGLGALGYLLPFVRACGGWTRVHLLDVPGFGHRRTARCPAGLDAAATTTAAWLRQGPPDVLLLGHSTGAQIALRAALAEPGRVRSLVLAGPSFPPDARRLRPLARRIARTLPYEDPGELPAVLPEYLRGARRLPELLASTLADRPEDGVRDLDVPLVVLRGEHDHLAPQDWCERLSGTVQVLPGAHNGMYPHPQAWADAVRGLA